VSKNIRVNRKNMISITLEGKVTALQAVIVALSGALVARLLMPGTKPLNLNIGGKYSHTVHALVIGVIFAGIYVGLLYAYNDMRIGIAKSNLYATGGASMHGFSQSQCTSCKSTLPPQPKNGGERSTVRKLSAHSGGGDDCVIGHKARSGACSAAANINDYQ